LRTLIGPWALLTDLWIIMISC